jgi:hypothetical protein
LNASWHIKKLSASWALYQPDSASPGLSFSDCQLSGNADFIPNNGILSITTTFTGCGVDGFVVHDKYRLFSDVKKLFFYPDQVYV